MINSEQPSAERMIVDGAGLSAFMSRIATTHAWNEITFLCIGTDRSTGDCLGPWVGSLLEERGIQRVIGTLREPCDADRLPAIMTELAADQGQSTIIAVDACLGRSEHVGSYIVHNGPLIPAQSVNKRFPPVGTYSIAGVVNAVSLKPYWTLQSTSLYRVMGMAKQISDAIGRHFQHY